MPEPVVWQFERSELPRYQQYHPPHFGSLASVLFEIEPQLERFCAYTPDVGLVAVITPGWELPDMTCSRLTARFLAWNLRFLFRHDIPLETIAPAPMTA